MSPRCSGEAFRCGFSTEGWGDFSLAPKLGWCGGCERHIPTHSSVLELTSQFVVLWAEEFIQG